jgi:6-phosphogluconolactonase
MQIHSFDQADAWLSALLADFKTTAEKAITERGVCHIALSGGSTPKPFYAALGKSDLPWDKIEWWLGDERTVPPTAPDSNERMAKEAFQSAHFEQGFHTWHTASDWETCAIHYGRLLKEKMGRPAVFDVILLGVGTDGHTASLFPGTPGLEESHHNCILNPVPQLNTQRMTVTFPVLNAARAIWFLVKGADKKSMVDRLVAKDRSIPSACIENPSQSLYWSL